MRTGASQAAALGSKLESNPMIIGKEKKLSRFAIKTAESATVCATVGVKCRFTDGYCSPSEGSEKPSHMESSHLTVTSYACPSTPPLPAADDLATRFGKSSLLLPDSYVQRKLTFMEDNYGRINQKAPSRAHQKVVPEGTLGLFNSEKTESKKRCAWITPQSDAAYAVYHDEEWGVPVHDDRRLFELLVFAGAQTEIAWSSILSKREAYRDAFAQFEPAIVATYDTTKVASLKSQSDMMQREARVQSVVSNAKLVMKIVEELGSFDEYLWGFVNHKPIVNNYRQPKCIPVKTAKSELISKDLQKRGFRHAGPMVVYSLMQAAGMANDHLLHCFRYHECNALTAAPHHHQHPTTILNKPPTSRKPCKPIVSRICC